MNTTDDDVQLFTACKLSTDYAEYFTYSFCDLYFLVRYIL